MRKGQQAELIGSWGSQWISGEITSQDIHHVINGASRYSPWAAQSIRQGYLTASGGHRIGISGRVSVHDGALITINDPTSLCIRVAADHPGIAKGLPDKGSILIIGRPGAGKTTLLRDLIRQRSSGGWGSVSVVDEREELFPDGCFESGSRTDVLSGCAKAQGIEMMLRTMGPDTIAVDEITANEDCEALIHSSRCGVSLLATAHAATREEMNHRPVYQKLLSNKVFDWLVVLQQDKSWKLERM